MFIPQGTQSETIATLCQGEEGSGSLGGIHLHIETAKLWNIPENFFCFCRFPLDYDLFLLFMGSWVEKKDYFNHSHLLLFSVVFSVMLTAERKH